MKPDQPPAAAAPQIATQTAQVIQPQAPKPQPTATSPTEQPTQYRSARVDMSAIYPDATQGIGANSYTVSQKAAMAITQSESAEATRPVSLRAKSVLIVGAILAISTVSGIYVLLTNDDIAQNGTIQTVFGIFVAIQALMTLYLLFSNDTSSVLFVLKILIVFQLLGLFSSLINPTALVFTGIGLILLFIAHSSVKSLRN